MNAQDVEQRGSAAHQNNSMELSSNSVSCAEEITYTSLQDLVRNKKFNIR